MFARSPSEAILEAFGWAKMGGGCLEFRSETVWEM